MTTVGNRSAAGGACQGGVAALRVLLRAPCPHAVSAAGPSGAAEEPRRFRAEGWHLSLQSGLVPLSEAECILHGITGYLRIPF